MEELISRCTCPPMQNSPVQVGPLHDSHRILSRRKLSAKGRWHNYGLTGVVLQGRVWGNHWDTSYNFILNFEVYFPLTEENTGLNGPLISLICSLQLFWLLMLSSLCRLGWEIGKLEKRLCSCHCQGLEFVKDTSVYIPFTRTVRPS